MRQNLFDSELTASLLRSGNKFETLVQTLGATFTMSVGMPQMLYLDPGGAARTVLLPAETAGLFFVIVNTADADELLTVQEDSGTTDIAYVEEGECCLFFCDGTTWYAFDRPRPDRVVAIADAATYTVLPKNTGKVHMLPDLTADIVITLPTAARGLAYSFIYGGVAADAQDWAIDTGADANYYVGGVLYVDDEPAANSVAADGDSNSIVNVLTPEAGTRVNVACDGTLWYIDGVIASENSPTFADQA